MAVEYLHNRTSLSRNNQKAPIEALNAYLKSHNIPFNRNPDDLRLDQNGIFAYEVKAFPLITKFKRGNIKTHFKINLRAYIGYLIRYQATNIYRIQVPKLREVLTIRDMTFQEDQFFNLDTKETGILIAEYQLTAEILRIPDFQPFDSPFGTTLRDDLDLEEPEPSLDRASPERPLEP